MRAFIKQFGLFIAIQLVIAGSVLWSYYRQYPSAQNFLAASIDKHALLERQASPRLILIGGSSLAFGVNSATIAEACNRHPVNMGLHAALGLKFMLSEVEPHVRVDDWIIVSPEYQQFARLSGQSAWLVNILEIDSSNARYFDSQQWASVFDTGVIQRFGTITRSVFDRPGRFFSRNTFAVRARAHYRRYGFDRNGDMVAHLNQKPRGLSENEFQLRYRDEPVQEAISVVNHFARAAEARGAKVFFSHPPLPRKVFEQNHAAIDRLEAELKAKLIAPQLDSAEELVFPVEFFFDTWYHLASPGVDKRTKLLAARIAEQNKGPIAGSADR